MDKIQTKIENQREKVERSERINKTLVQKLSAKKEDLELKRSEEAKLLDNISKV